MEKIELISLVLTLIQTIALLIVAVAFLRLSAELKYLKKSFDKINDMMMNLVVELKELRAKKKDSNKDSGLL